MALQVFVHLEGLALDGAASLDLLREGESLYASREYSKALDSCRRGLRILGDGYSSPDLMDDTDLKLFAATLREKEGRLDDAASVTCRVLRARYELWESRLQMGKEKPNHSINTDALKRAGWFNNVSSHGQFRYSIG